MVNPLLKTNGGEGGLGKGQKAIVIIMHHYYYNYYYQHCIRCCAVDTSKSPSDGNFFWLLLV